LGDRPGVALSRQQRDCLGLDEPQQLVAGFLGFADLL